MSEYAREVAMRERLLEAIAGGVGFQPGILRAVDDIMPLVQEAWSEGSRAMAMARKNTVPLNPYVRRDRD